jgi:hypothetical protein
VKAVPVVNSIRLAWDVESVDPLRDGVSLQIGTVVDLFRPRVMVAAVLLTGGSSLAIAQNGPATGGEHPVAGGAAGGGYGWYGGAPGYGYAYPRLYSYYRPYRHHRHWRYY